MLQWSVPGNSAVIWWNFLKEKKSLTRFCFLRCRRLVEMRIFLFFPISSTFSSVFNFVITEIGNPHPCHHIPVSCNGKDRHSAWEMAGIGNLVAFNEIISLSSLVTGGDWMRTPCDTQEELGRRGASFPSSPTSPWSEIKGKKKPIIRLSPFYPLKHVESLITRFTSTTSTTWVLHIPHSVQWNNNNMNIWWQKLRERKEQPVNYYFAVAPLHGRRRRRNIVSNAVTIIHRKLSWRGIRDVPGPHKIASIVCCSSTQCPVGVRRPQSYSTLFAARVRWRIVRCGCEVIKRTYLLISIKTLKGILTRKHSSQLAVICVSCNDYFVGHHLSAAEAVVMVIAAN